MCKMIKKNYRVDIVDIYIFYRESYNEVKLKKKNQNNSIL